MAKKKVQPLFDEPVKKKSDVKSSTKKEIKPKKEKDPKKQIPIKTKADKKPVVSKVNPKKEVIKKSPKKEIIKKEIPKPKKVISPKVKEVKIEELEEEKIEIQEEKKPSYVKESKRKPKIDKNAPPKKIKHKLKVGDKVIVTFLGQPRYGVIIELSPEGMYKVKTDKGLTLPRAKHEEGEIPDKTYPSYIIKVL